MATQISNGGAVPHASGHEDLLARLVRFLTGVDYPTFSGSGGVRLRYVRAKATAVNETWTIVCTNVGTGTFSVTGSVSGAQAAATVGTPYDNGKIAFTLTNVTSAPVLSDTITVVTTTGSLVATGQSWELIKNAVPVVDEVHVFLRGRGNAGTDQIYAGLRAYKSVASDWYNLQLRGATGYVETASDIANMPNASGYTDVCLLNGSMPYWFIANARRFTFVAKVSTVYESAYIGFLLPTGTPSEYPYPLAIGGSHAQASRRFSDNLGAGIYGTRHRAFFNPGGTTSASPQSSLHVREKGGTWVAIVNRTYSSGENTDTTNNVSPTVDSRIYRNIDGSYTLYPLTVHISSPSNNVLGDFEGVFMVSGISNPSENLVQVGGVDHLVVQNTFRTDPWEYAAFRLE